MENENPFVPAVAEMAGRFAQPSQQPQFGLAEVLITEPLQLRYAGQIFDQEEILLNYTLQKYTVEADAQNLYGDLYGPTDFCTGGFQNHYQKVNPGADEGSSRLSSTKVEISPSGIHKGDLLFVYYSQVDQRLVALCKVV